MLSLQLNRTQTDGFYHFIALEALYYFPESGYHQKLKFYTNYPTKDKEPIISTHLNQLLKLDERRLPF